MLCMVESTQVLGSLMEFDGERILSVLLFMYLVYKNFFVHKTGVLFLKQIKKALDSLLINPKTIYKYPYLHLEIFSKFGKDMGEHFLNVLKTIPGCNIDENWVKIKTEFDVRKIDPHFYPGIPPI